MLLMEQPRKATVFNGSGVTRQLLDDYCEAIRRIHDLQHDPNSLIAELEAVRRSTAETLDL